MIGVQRLAAQRTRSRVTAGAFQPVQAIAQRLALVGERFAALAQARGLGAGVALCLLELPLFSFQRLQRDDLGASSAGRVAIVSSASVAAPKWGMANYVTLKAAAEMWMQALASGWRTKELPAAAVTFVVGALDKQGAVDDLAAACAALWSVGHEQLNGAIVELAAASDGE